MKVHKQLPLKREKIRIETAIVTTKLNLVKGKNEK